MFPIVLTKSLLKKSMVYRASIFSFALLFAVPLASYGASNFESREAYPQNIAALPASVEQAQPELAEISGDLSRLPPDEQKTGKKKLGPKGLLDPHYPGAIHIKPESVDFPAALNITAPPGLAAGEVKLLTLSHHYLKGLSHLELKTLLDHLNNIPLKIKWQDKAGHVQTGSKHLGLFRSKTWVKTTAAAALTFEIGRQKHHELFARMVALSPHSVSALLQGRAGAVMDAKTAAQALVLTLSQMDSQSPSFLAQAARKIAHTYIAYWAEDHANHLILALTTLILETSNQMNQAPLPFTLKQKGILLGSLLAACMEQAKKITSHDERRLWVVNSISNLVWASTTFLGAVPIAGAVAASVAAIISIGVVVWAVVHNKIGKRDYIPKIHEIEGHIEFSALDTAEHNQKPGMMVDMLSLLAWMRASVHVNGYAD